MSTFEDRALATANRMLAKYGQTVSWSQLRDGAPADASKPWKPTNAAPPTPFTPKVAFIPGNSKRYAALIYQSGGEIARGYIFGIMAGNVGFVPKLKDKVVRGGVTYSLEWIDEINPRGTPLAYILGIMP